eukprot:TRINITY_DN30812_c1_g1_i1.p1 TRINITY_DN30812_c1_g1~~TRINITY_DN30812_c1_g1_i1.p1  ORF type:complete len:179 (-),score=16.85 TRINITY_DN30812_c1_g1_i1:175-711(-)
MPVRFDVTALPPRLMSFLDNIAAMELQIYDPRRCGARMVASLGPWPLSRTIGETGSPSEIQFDATTTTNQPTTQPRDHSVFEATFHMKPGTQPPTVEMHGIYHGFVGYTTNNHNVVQAGAPLPLKSYLANVTGKLEQQVKTVTVGVEQDTTAGDVVHKLLISLVTTPPVTPVGPGTQY